MRIALLLAVLFALPGVFSVSLGVNETYQFNYTGWNGTAPVLSSESFVCAENVTACVPLTLNLSLLPGEIRTTTAGFCTASASCEVGNASNSTCVVSRTLAPGERYQNVGGSCNIDITAGAVVTTNVSSLPTVPYRGSIQISNTGGILTITVDNQSSAVDASRSGVLYRQDVELTCPVEPKFQETEDVEYLVDQCKDWVPMLDETISTLVENTRICGDSAKSHVEDIKLCGDRERGLLAQVGTLTAERDSAITSRQVAEAQAAEAGYARGTAESERDTFRFLMWFFVIVWAITAALLAAFVLQSRQYRRTMQ